MFGGFVTYFDMILITNPSCKTCSAGEVSLQCMHFQLANLCSTAKGSGNRCGGPRNRFGSKMAGASSDFEGSMFEANILFCLIYFVGACFQSISLCFQSGGSRHL